MCRMEIFGIGYAMFGFSGTKTRFASCKCIAAAMDGETATHEFRSRQFNLSCFIDIIRLTYA